MCPNPVQAGVMERIRISIDDTKRVVGDISVGKANFLMLAFYLIQLGELLEGLSEEEDLIVAESSKASFQGMADVLEGIFAFANHCRNRSRIYLLYKCNEVVTEITEHIRKVVECLAQMLLENDNISPSTKDKITEMQNSLSSALFFAEPEHQKIAEEISECLAGNQSEEIEATGLLRRIAQVLNLQPFEAAELKQELEIDLEATRTERGLYALLESAAVLDDVRKLAAGDSSSGPADDVAIPSSFYCPITGQIMEDPVMLVEAGYTYERYAITKWFERGHRTCPDTGKELESLELVPNLTLKQNMEEVFDKKRHKTMLHAIYQIKAQESPQEVEEAVNTVKQLMDVHPKYKRLIVTLHGIQPLVEHLKPADQNLKERILRILYSIAALGDEYKSSIIETGAVPILLRLLQRNPAGSGGSVQLLLELSKFDRGRVAILAFKASVVVVASAFNLCTHDQKSQAEQLLCTLCEYDKAATVQAASSGIFRPLVTKLTSGNEAVQLEMTEVVCTIDLNESGIGSLVDAGAVPPLLLILQNGSEASILEAAKALRRLSSSESNKVAIAKCGTIPVLVKALSYPIPNLGVEIMATLANLATDRQSAAEIDQQGAVARLFEMLEAKDIIICEYALKTLQCMAKDSQTVRQSVADLKIIPKIYDLLKNEELSPSSRTSTLNLLCTLAEDRITRQAGYRGVTALISIYIAVLCLSGLGDCRNPVLGEVKVREEQQRPHILLPSKNEEYDTRAWEQLPIESRPFQRGEDGNFKEKEVSGLGVPMEIRPYQRGEDGTFQGERSRFRSFRFGRPGGCHHGKFMRKGEREHMQFPGKREEVPFSFHVFTVQPHRSREFYAHAEKEEEFWSQPAERDRGRGFANEEEEERRGGGWMVMERLRRSIFGGH